MEPAFSGDLERLSINDVSALRAGPGIIFGVELIKYFPEGTATWKPKYAGGYLESLVIEG